MRSGTVAIPRIRYRGLRGDTPEIIPDEALRAGEAAKETIYREFASQRLGVIDYIASQAPSDIAGPLRSISSNWRSMGSGEIVRAMSQLEFSEFSQGTRDPIVAQFLAEWADTMNRAGSARDDAEQKAIRIARVRELDPPEPKEIPAVPPKPESGGANCIAILLGIKEGTEQQKIACMWPLYVVGGLLALIALGEILPRD